jgi:hypothetical protein
MAENLVGWLSRQLFPFKSNQKSPGIFSGDFFNHFNMKKILIPGLVTGCILFVLSYGGLFLAIRFLPALFTEYNNPLFNSDGSRDVLFYFHAFIFSFALSWFWDRFKGLFKGQFIVRGIEFGLVYSVVALLPVMWISFSSLDVSIVMVSSWFAYGLMQAIVAGIVFARVNP